jgi:DNA-binding FadR family transcriptional regulator
VGFAADARGPEETRALRRALADLEQAAGARDWCRALDADLQLHLAILEATRLPVLIALLRPMQQIIPATSYPPDFDSEQDFEVERHSELVEAVASGDGEAARRAMRRHFDFLGDPRYGDLHARPFREAPLIRAQLERRARAA